MDKLENWIEVTNGLYRHIVAASSCYEIYILLRYDDQDILDAYASLYVAGSWETDDGKSFFDRECVLEESTVRDCLAAAKKDFEENFSYD